MSCKQPKEKFSRQRLCLGIISALSFELLHVYSAHFLTVSSNWLGIRVLLIARPNSSDVTVSSGLIFSSTINYRPWRIAGMQRKSVATFDRQGVPTPASPASTFSLISMKYDIDCI